jgi:hypothetical protein
MVMISIIIIWNPASTNTNAGVSADASATIDIITIIDASTDIEINTAAMTTFFIMLRIFLTNN